ncbi:MAG TPA: FHA domain-containing protein [Polyangiaceae bacterium]|nr:FHA domain-containing protein [Polyangiaceae bacterium]
MSAPDDKSELDTTYAGDLSIVSAIEQARKKPRLEQVRGAGAPRTHQVLLDETVIGRSSQATICIESTLISRKHVVIRKNGAEFRCQDLDSANGMYLNGVKAHSAVLHDGDAIQIGDVVFVFHEGS